MLVTPPIDRCPRCGWDHSTERSGKSHRFLHVVISLAFANWPERAAFTPSSSAHLRAWLFCHDDVAFHDEIEAAPAGAAAIEAMLGSVRAAGGFAFVRPDEHAGKLRLRIPRSAALKKNGGELGGGAFYGLLDRLLGTIEAETGISRGDLRREGLAAVAPRPRLGRKAA